MCIENNNLYALKILNGICTVEEVYQHIKKFKPKTCAKNSFEILNNQELRDRVILEESKYYTNLLNLILLNSDYCIEYLNSKYCQKYDKEILFSQMICDLRKYRKVLQNNKEFLIYTILKIDDENENCFELGWHIYNNLNNIENIFQQKEIYEKFIGNYQMVHGFVTYMSHQSLARTSNDSKFFKSEIYNRYKNRLFSAKRSSITLVDYLEIFVDLVDIEDIRVVLKKVYKEKWSFTKDRFDKVIAKCNRLNQDDLDLINADLIMLRLVS